MLNFHENNATIKHLSAPKTCLICISTFIFGANMTHVLV